MDDVERIAAEVLRRLQGDAVLPKRPAAGAGTPGPQAGAAVQPEAGAAVPPEVQRREASHGAAATGVASGIPVNVSARHVHVARSALDSLFGEGSELTKIRDLSQPGEFVSGERVTAVGPSGRALEVVRIVGPVRSYTQLELSRTDAVRLGIDPPVRRSGDLQGSAPVTLVGPAGTVILREGAIRAMRHVHMNERDAEQYGVKDGDMVRVRFPGVRALVLENVLVRVGKSFALEMHLDTDDANAADIRPPTTVEILG